MEACLREYRSEPDCSALDLGEAWEGCDFDDWFVAVPTAKGGVELLCCLEDQTRVRGCVARGTARSECRVPLCAECKTEVDGPR